MRRWILAGLIAFTAGASWGLFGPGGAALAQSWLATIDPADCVPTASCGPTKNCFLYYNPTNSTCVAMTFTSSTTLTLSTCIFNQGASSPCNQIGKQLNFPCGLSGKLWICSGQPGGSPPNCTYGTSTTNTCGCPTVGGTVFSGGQNISLC